MGGHWCQNCPARGPGVSWPGDGWLWVRVRGAHGWRGQGWPRGLVAAVSKRFAPQHLQFLLWKLPKAPLGAEACHSLHVVAGAVPFLQMPGERWQCPKDTGGRTAALHQGSERPDGILCLETFTPHPLQQRTPQHPSIPRIITGSSPGAAGDVPHPAGTRVAVGLWGSCMNSSGLRHQPRASHAKTLRDAPRNPPRSLGLFCSWTGSRAH